MRDNAATARQRSYNGLMTPSDKKLITKIQLIQLHTENPYLDDFYFEAYSRRDQDPKKHHLILPKFRFLSTKPKGDSITSEGALGIIARTSVNRPRMLVQISADQGKKPEMTKEVLDKARTEKVLSKTKQIKVLNAIEGVFDTIITLEDMNHQLPTLSEEERAAKFEEMAHLVHHIETQLTTPAEGYFPFFSSSSSFFPLLSLSFFISNTHFLPLVLE